MAKGDKKKAFMERTGKDEAAYYAHSRRVCSKRHFNMRVTQLMQFYGFDPLQYLEEKAQRDFPEVAQDESNSLLWLVQDCKCPLTILRAFLDYYFSEDHEHTKEAHIATHLRRFPEESFRRFGDINQVPKNFFKIYSDENGMPIDVQAMEISEISGLEITVQDITDFATAYPKGTHTFKPVSWADRLAEAFYKLTGMKLTYDFARQLIKMMDNKEVIDLTDNVPF